MVEGGFWWSAHSKTAVQLASFCLFLSLWMMGAEASVNGTDVIECEAGKYAVGAGTVFTLAGSGIFGYTDGAWGFP